MMGSEDSATPLPVFDAGFAVRHPCRLLVADDNAINRKLVLSMLRRLGYEPVMVEDGTDVIAAFLISPFDVLLLDVEMPGLDGPSTTARIRREFPAAVQPVIIALTAHTGAEKRAELIAAGMDEYLGKPLLPERLTALLARWPDLRPRSSGVPG